MWTCPECGRTFQRRHQTHYCGRAPESVEAYISRQPAAVQPYLLSLRQEILAAGPWLEESIRWHMPTYSQGRPVLQFAAYRDYVSLYAGPEVTEKLKQQLLGLSDNNGTVRLAYTRDVPSLLVREITRWCCKYYGVRT